MEAWPGWFQALIKALETPHSLNHRNINDLAVPPANKGLQTVADDKAKVKLYAPARLSGQDLGSQLSLRRIAGLADTSATLVKLKEQLARLG